ncbi:MAG: hypothetical protein GY719_35050 [bacterium]|nr:hypothetical protein [bacterium]
MRTLLRVFEVNPLLFGSLPAGLLVAFTKKHQRLGDSLAGTVVVPRHSHAPSGDPAGSDGLPEP